MQANKSANLILLLTLTGVLLMGCSPFRVAGKSTLYPQPHGYVNDYNHLLKKSETGKLENIISAHEKENGDQIAIAIVNLKQLNGMSIESWSLELARYWGVGEKDKNNGVVIVLVSDSRELRIQNASGVISRLTDEETAKIINQDMIPAFKKEQYAEGFESGLKSIIQELNSPE